jgi:hypothetical protein
VGIPETFKGLGDMLCGNSRDIAADNDSRPGRDNVEELLHALAKIALTLRQARNARP